MANDLPSGPPEPAGSTLGALRGVAAGARRLRSHAWILGAGAATLVLLRGLEFRPPAQVRATADTTGLVGEAPRQSFSPSPAAEQTVEFRATLRLWHEGERRVGGPDPRDDEASDVLSQPVIATVLGMSATLDQLVRVEDGAVEIDVRVELTPRRDGRNLVLEREINVTSRTRSWLRRDPVESTRAYDHTFVARPEEQPSRVVFSVDERLFAVDVETRATAPSAATAIPAATVAGPSGATKAW